MCHNIEQQEDKTANDLAEPTENLSIATDGCRPVVRDRGLHTNIWTKNELTQEMLNTRQTK